MTGASPDFDPNRTLMESIDDLQEQWMGIADDASEELRAEVAQTLGRLLDLGSSIVADTELIERLHTDNQEVDDVENSDEDRSGSEHSDDVNRDGGQPEVENNEITTDGDDDVERYREVRNAAMAANYSSFVTKLDALEQGQPDEAGFIAMPHQRYVFGRTNDFVQRPVLEGELNAGLVASSFASGKTTMKAINCRALGIGEIVDDSGRPLSALILEPTLQALDGVIGKDRDGKGLAAFAPGIEVGEWNGQIRDMSKPVTVMTYRSFLLLSDAERAELKRNIDVFMPDEIHRGLGECTAEVLTDFMEGIRTIASTSTPDFSKERGVKSELGITHVIARISPREGIEEWGYANGVQILMLASGARVRASGAGSVLVEEDSAHLMDERRRNDLILDSLQLGAELGVGGLGWCQRGGGSKHARDIADMANKRRIQDPNTGEWRNMRVKAIGDFLPAADRRAILKEFNDGLLDSLTFTDYLKEAFDSDRIGLIVGGNLTTSQLDMDQTLGRGARLKDRPTICIQICDRLEGSTKPAANWLVTMGEQNFKQGVVIDHPAREVPKWNFKSSYNKRSGAKSSTSYCREDGGISLADLPESLRSAAEELTGTLIDELIVVPQIYQKPPEDWIPLHTTAYYRSVTSFVAIQRAKRLTPMVKGEGGAWYIPPGAEAELDKYIDIMAEPEEQLVPYTTAQTELKTSWRKIDEVAAHLGIPVQKRKIPGVSGSHAGRQLSRTHLELIRSHLDKTHPLVDPEVEVAVVDIAARLNRTPGSVRMHIARTRINTHFKYSSGRDRLLCVDIQTAASIERNMGVMPPDDIQDLPEDTVVDLRDPDSTETVAEEKDDAPATNADKIDQIINQNDAPHVAPTAEAQAMKPKPRKGKKGRPSRMSAAPRAGESDAAGIGEALGLGSGAVQSIIDRLERTGKLRDLPVGVVRTRPGSHPTRHYRGATLEVIMRAAEARAQELENNGR